MADRSAPTAHSDDRRHAGEPALILGRREERLARLPESAWIVLLRTTRETA
jgi:hypothetical protein